MARRNDVIFLIRYTLIAYCMSILILVSYDYRSALAAPILKDTNLKVVTLVTGLSNPTSMAFIGPNDILVLEKNTGLVKRVKNGAVLPGSLLDVNVATSSERGLLGIDVAKVSGSSMQFKVFLYYTFATRDGGNAIANRIYKYDLVIGSNLGPSQGRMTLSALILNLPATPGPNHDGGKVVIGPDSNVYTIIGDLNRNTQAQNFETGTPPDGTGGVLRVTQDGKTVGPGIIGSGSPLNKYYAYGIRNGFGLEIDPVSNRLWDTENGPSSNDEINLVEPGFNSGWEDLMGFAPSGYDFNKLANFGGKGKYSQPEFVWTRVVAPTALEFLSSSKLGTSYQNDLFVADFNKGRIYDFNLNSARTGLHLTGVLTDRKANTDSELQQVIFGEGFGRISDIKVGNGDGYLYVLSYGTGAIYKILPKSAPASSSGIAASRGPSEQSSNTNENNPFANSQERKAQSELQKKQDIVKRSDELKDQKQKESNQVQIPIEEAEPLQLDRQVKSIDRNQTLMDNSIDNANKPPQSSLSTP